MFLPNLVTILTIKVQIVGNDEYLILDIEAGWQGAYHDTRIWKNSNVKTVIEMWWPKLQVCLLQLAYELLTLTVGFVSQQA